jgi:HlyD family secretion protein
MTGANLQSATANDAARRRQLKAVPPAKRPIVAEFQSDAVEVEERTPPRITRITLYFIVALIVAAVTWASLSSVDSIVAAQGKLITTSSNFVVQPLETSVIREIHVKVGDIVRRGQALATLDPTFSQADVDQLRTRFAALDAASKRLNAELNGANFTATDPANADDLLQARLFEQRKAFYETSLQNYDAQIASAQANLQTSHDEEAVLVQRLEALRSIEAIRQTLADRELGSRLNLLLSHDARLEVEDNLSRIRGNEVDLVHRVEKVRAERQVFIEDFRRTAYQELVDTFAKRNSTAEDLKKAELRRQLIVLTAPVDSVVLEVGSRSVGSVVREAETLFVLVPREAVLQAEVNVDGKDIGQVAVGQQVRLKFDAFPFQKHGTGLGVVRIISQDSFAPEAKSDGPPRSTPPYYRVLVDLTDMRLRNLPEQFQMIPGMTVRAEMTAGHRSVISYFLYPLLRGLDESVREP